MVSRQKGNKVKKEKDGKYDKGVKNERNVKNDVWNDSYVKNKNYIKIVKNETEQLMTTKTYNSML